MPFGRNSAVVHTPRNTWKTRPPNFPPRPQIPLSTTLCYATVTPSLPVSSAFGQRTFRPRLPRNGTSSGRMRFWVGFPRHLELAFGPGQENSPVTKPTENAGIPPTLLVARPRSKTKKKKELLRVRNTPNHCRTAPLMGPEASSVPPAFAALYISLVSHINNRHPPLKLLTKKSGTPDCHSPKLHNLATKTDGGKKN